MAFLVVHTDSAEGLYWTSDAFTFPFEQVSCYQRSKMRFANQQ
jgi:hypothetical protein